MAAYGNIPFLFKDVVFHCGEGDGTPLQYSCLVSTVSYDHWGDRHFRNLGRDSWAGLGHVLLSDLKQVTLSLSLNLVHL